MSATLLLAVPAALALAGVGAFLLGARRAEAAGRLVAVTAALALLAAIVLTVVVLADGPVSAVVEGRDGQADAGLFLDRVGAVLLLLVTGVGAVIASFARRYLRGDNRSTWLFACTALLLAATACLVSAATLTGLAAAWTLAGLALLALLATYRRLPAAQDGVRRTALAFAVGDVLLWAGVAVALVQWGELDLRRLGQTAPALVDDGATLALFSVLLVGAALARSAQLPFARWLPSTLAAPTPVSALLHAGVVNAGGILLVRTSPLFAASSIATALAFTAGALTAVYGTLLMLTKSDIKGALAHSTMGQMGFMIMTCGLGAFAATVFHLVAHGMYKATLFLGSGSAVRRHVRHLAAPPAPTAAPAPALVALALLVPAAALAVASLLLYPEVGGSSGSGALVVFAWVSGALALLGWLRRHPRPAGVVTGLVAVVAASFAYLALLRGATDLLAPALEGAGTATVSPWWLVAVGAALLGATLVRLRPGSALHDRLYVLALSAGSVRPGRSRHAVASGAPGPRIPGPAPSGPPASGPLSSGARDADHRSVTA